MWRRSKRRGRHLWRPLSLSVLDQGPDHGLVVVRGHAVALRDRSGGRRRAVDLPDTALGAILPSTCLRAQGHTRCGGGIHDSSRPAAGCYPVLPALTVEAGKPDARTVADEAQGTPRYQEA